MATVLVSAEYKLGNLKQDAMAAIETFPLACRLAADHHHGIYRNGRSKRCR
uniref:Transcriptional regulator n=1 Tax=Klebsiella pneumoniae TaxID=573 RepID=A0A2S1JIT7_KLEPN|nr:Transcriptional regulator [Klebsiella pneumoniae]